MPIVLKDNSLPLRLTLMVSCAGKRGRTFKAISSQQCGWFWKAGLVFKPVHGPDSEQTPPTLHLWHRHGVPGAAVGQPAVVAPVQSQAPGSVELPRVGQHGVFLQTLVTGLFKRHLVSDGGIIHFT